MSPKDDPLGNEVSDRLSKHTLWLNSDNFNEMVEASYDGLQPAAKELIAKIARGEVRDSDGTLLWRAMCAAALAVAEWRLTGRVRP